jgi:hypothetical protein
MCKSHYVRFWRSLKRLSITTCCAPCGAPAVADGRCRRHKGHARVTVLVTDPQRADVPLDSVSSDEAERSHDSREADSRVMSLTRALGKALRENAELRLRLYRLQRARIADCERLSARGRALRSGSAAGKRGFSRG